MGSRFLLIIGIAKLLEPSEVGIFGLILASVSLSVLIIGADFYVYSVRELLARPKDKWFFVIQHQLIAQVILYLFLLPLQLIFFFAGWLEWEYIFWFFCLLIVEHLSQEVNRLLVAMEKQILASFIMFVRQGLWVWVVLPIMYFFPSLQNLNNLFLAWLVGSLTAFIFGGLCVTKQLQFKYLHPIDKKWIIKGLQTGGWFLFATICFKGILTIDRFAIEFFSDLETLGAYVVYIGIVMSAFLFLDPAIFSFLYPKLLKTYQAHDFEQYEKTYKELATSTFVIGILLSLIIILLTPWVVSWIDNPSYIQHQDSIYILTLAGFLFGINNIPHYGLYAKRQNVWIISSHISALLLFLMAIAQQTFSSVILNVGIALCIAFGWMFVLKSYGYFMHPKLVSKFA